jgi:hypothetical protein
MRRVSCRHTRHNLPVFKRDPGDFRCEGFKAFLFLVFRGSSFKGRMPMDIIADEIYPNHTKAILGLDATFS